jgi:hypothetical protein
VDDRWEQTAANGGTAGGAASRRPRLAWAEVG